MQSTRIQTDFRFLRNSAITGIIVACLLVAGFGQKAPSKGPVTADEIITALAETKAGLPTANRIWIKQIGERGVDFEIDADIEKSLREAGGTMPTPTVIGAIRTIETANANWR